MTALVVDCREALIGGATAEFSADRVYRYALTRQWSDASPAVFVMLNPSTADAFVEDPTVRRCLTFARQWGAGGLTVLNAFALRSTDPRALDRHADPVGPDNDAVIRRHLAAAAGAPVVAAWGADKAVRAHGRDAALCAMVREATGQVLACLGTTKDGAPRHPLYVRGDARPRAWSG
jgi:hypothetical protein